MAHAQIIAHMFKSPRRLESDGRFRPKGEISYQHQLSVEGQAQVFYSDRDLTIDLNGSRSLLDTGKPVEVRATVDLEVRVNGNKPVLQAVDLVKLEEADPKPVK